MLKDIIRAPWSNLHDGYVPTNADEVVDSLSVYQTNFPAGDEHFALNPTPDIIASIKYAMNLHLGKGRKAVNPHGEFIPYVHHSLRTSLIVARLTKSEPARVLACLIGVMHTAYTDQAKKMEFFQFLTTLKCGRKVVVLAQKAFEYYGEVQESTRKNAYKIGLLKSISKTKEVELLIVKVASHLEHLDADVQSMRFYGYYDYFNKRSFHNKPAQIRQFHEDMCTLIDDLPHSVKNDYNLILLSRWYRSLLAEFDALHPNAEVSSVPEKEEAVEN